MKKVSIFLSSLLVLSSFSLSNVSAAEGVNNEVADLKVEEAAVEGMENIADIVDNELVFLEDEILLDTNQVEITDADIESVNEFLKENGMDLQYTKDDIVDLYENSVKEINEEIKNGTLELLEDGSIIEAADEDFYVQGGSTYDKTIVGGKIRYKSTANAKVWTRDLRSLGHANAAGALVGGVVFGGVGALPNGLTSIWLYNLADKVDYRNGLNNRGVKVTLYFSLIFKTASQ